MIFRYNISGLIKMQPLGEKFDPNLHEVCFSIAAWRSLALLLCLFSSCVVRIVDYVATLRPAQLMLPCLHDSSGCFQFAVCIPATRRRHSSIWWIRTRSLALSPLCKLRDTCSTIGVCALRKWESQKSQESNRHTM